MAFALRELAQESYGPVHELSGPILYPDSTNGELEKRKRVTCHHAGRELEFTE